MAEALNNAYSMVSIIRKKKKSIHYKVIMHTYYVATHCTIQTKNIQNMAAFI